MSQTFFALLTAVGEAKLANAAALGTQLQISRMAVGDGNGVLPTPNRNQTALVREWYRADLNSLIVDPANSSQVIAELVIPEGVGGHWLREMSLYDAAGDMIAVANCPESYKPVVAEGSGKTQVMRMVLTVSSTESVQLKIDPSVVLATRAYADAIIVAHLAAVDPHPQYTTVPEVAAMITAEVDKRDHKESVRYTTTAAIALNGLAVQAGGDWAAALTAGDRILVKNQAAAKDNGLYLAAAGAWVRASDADISSEVTPGLVVGIEQGAALADTRWQLVTDGAIVLGTTALTFQNVTQGYAPLASPIFTGDPKTPTPAQFDFDTSLANTEFVRRAGGNFSGVVGYSASATLSASDVGKLVSFSPAAAAQALVLPLANAVPPGSAYCIFSGGQAYTLGRSGADVITTEGINSAALAIPAGGQIFAVSDGATVWRVFGPGVVGRQGDFGSSQAPNGHEKHPNGLIYQWGSLGDSSWVANSPRWVTFPVPFPNGVFQIIAGSSNANYWGGAYVSTTPGMNAGGFGACMSGAGSQTFNYIAIGR